MKKNRFKFCFDLLIAVVFILLFSPKATGLAFHEIVGLLLGIAFLVHILLNKNWVMAVSKKIFSKNTKGKTKLSYLLNFILLLDMVMIIISGLFISKVILPHFRYFPGVNWLPLHIVSSIIGLIIVGIHLGLHWNWIKQIGNSFPKLTKLFSFHKPSRKVVARILLIIGTISLLIQLPKLVMLTPRIFSVQAVGIEERHGHEFKDREDFDHQFIGPENERFREHGEIRERGEFEGHDKSFSVVRLIGIIPVLLFYSSTFGAIAFYTHFFEKRAINKRRIRAS